MARTYLVIKIDITRCLISSFVNSFNCNRRYHNFNIILIGDELNKKTFKSLQFEKILQTFYSSTSENMMLSKCASNAEKIECIKLYFTGIESQNTIRCSRALMRHEEGVLGMSIVKTVTSNLTLLWEVLHLR